MQAPIIRPTRGRRAAGIVTALFAALAVAGCSASATLSDAAEAMSPEAAVGYDTASGASADGAASGEMPQSEGNSAGAPRAPSEPAPGVPPMPNGRQIIRTAEVTVTVKVDPEEGKVSASAEALAAAAADAARAVRALVTLPGGYVSGSDGRGSTITVTLRIPAGSYESVMDRLSDLGAISNITESTQDVTGQLVDIKSRITSQRTSVDRLRGLMTEAKSMQDVIAIESELARREADLESLESQQAQLSDAVALSTISVTVDAISTPVESETEPEPAEKHNAFMTGLIAGWNGLVAASRSVATVLGGLLPFLIPLALIALVVLWIRRGRRGRDGAATSQISPPTEPAVEPGAEALPAAPAGDALHRGPDVHQVDENAHQSDQP